MYNYNRKVHDPQDTVDLHGLHVQEAMAALAERLKEIDDSTTWITVAYYCSVHTLNFL